MEEHLFIVERQLRGAMPASTLESNLATTRGQMIDLEERMGTQEARQMAHATDARETGRARYQRCLRVCCVRPAGARRPPHGRVASGQISRACGTRQPLETAPLCQPASF